MNVYIFKRRVGKIEKERKLNKFLPTSKVILVFHFKFFIVLYIILVLIPFFSKRSFVVLV